MRVVSKPFAVGVDVEEQHERLTLGLTSDSFSRHEVKKDSLIDVTKLWLILYFEST